MAEILSVSDGLGVKDIARYEDGVRPALMSNGGKALDDTEARLEQGGSIIGFELAEITTDLPVGSVQDGKQGWDPLKA